MIQSTDLTGAAPTWKAPHAEKRLKETAIEAHLLAALILSPFVLAFIYAAVHEYGRFKSEGRATYGLVFDDETGTSYLTGIGKQDEAFDPNDFNPDNYNDTEDTLDVGDRRS